MSCGNEWLVCARTHAALGKLPPILQGMTAADDPQLQEMAVALILRGGKRLRPALLLLSASFGECEEGSLLRAAAALELVHVASLYHDDVMDRAPTRRGGPSANARWGVALASLAGTYLFARATATMASLGEAVNRLSSHASAELCAGQLQEVENAYNLALSVDDHLAIISRKTATLFSLPCQLGALLSGASDAVAAALFGYGQALGVAFQLTDDALDMSGQASLLGKATGTDLREGIYSLPVLLALQDAGVGEQLRALLSRTHLSVAEVDQALSLVRKSGAVAAALSGAQAWSVKSREALAVLPVGAARNSLERLAAHAVTRSS